MAINIKKIIATITLTALAVEAMAFLYGFSRFLIDEEVAEFCRVLVARAFCFFLLRNGRGCRVPMSPTDCLWQFGYLLVLLVGVFERRGGENSVYEMLVRSAQGGTGFVIHRASLKAGNDMKSASSPFA